MLDFRRYRNFSRSIFKVNCALGIIFLITQCYAYKLLIEKPRKHYYVQTNNGFIFPIQPTTPEGPLAPVIETYFE